LNFLEIQPEILVMRIWRTRCFVTAYFFPNRIGCQLPPAVGAVAKRDRQKSSAASQLNCSLRRARRSTSPAKKVGGNVGVGAKLETSSKSSSVLAARHPTAIQSSRKLINTRPLSHWRSPTVVCSATSEVQREQTLAIGRSLINAHCSSALLVMERLEEASDLFESPPTCYRLSISIKKNFLTPVSSCSSSPCACVSSFSSGGIYVIRCQGWPSEKLRGPGP
jgi:hypothetical protein